MKYKKGDYIKLIGMGNEFWGIAVITKVFKRQGYTAFGYKIISQDVYKTNLKDPAFDKNSCFYIYSKVVTKDELMLEEL